MRSLNTDTLFRQTGLDILGLNPAVHDFAYFDLWAKPLGLLKLLGALRERGHRVELLDCLYEARQSPLKYGRWKLGRQSLDKPELYASIARRYYRYGLAPEEIQQRLARRRKPDLILVTSIMSYWYPGVREAIEALRQLFPSTPIALGGIYAALCPRHASSLGADFLLSGSASGPEAPTPLDLYQEPGYAIIQSSRGCPWRCAYCASFKLHGPFAARPLPELYRDLDQQLALGPKDLAFYDDALLWRPQERFYPLLDYIEKNYPQLRLHAPNGLAVASVDETLARSLARAGFQTIRLSLEGLDPLTQRASGHKSGAEQYQRAAEELLKAGFAPSSLETYILAGLPGQRLEDIASSINFVKGLGGRPKLCEYSPIPGSPLFERVAALYPAVLNEPLWHNNSVFTAQLSGFMTAAEFQALKDLCRPDNQSQAKA